MILVRKKFKFFLYMYLVKIRLKTESSAFHRLALSSIKTAHSVCFTFFEINLYLQEIVKYGRRLVTWYNF